MKARLLPVLVAIFLACNGGPPTVDGGLVITQVAGEYELVRVNGVDLADSNLVFEVRGSCILDGRLEIFRVFATTGFFALNPDSSFILQYAGGSTCGGVGGSSWSQTFRGAYRTIGVLHDNIILVDTTNTNTSISNVGVAARNEANGLAETLLVVFQTIVAQVNIEYTMDFGR